MGERAMGRGGSTRARRAGGIAFTLLGGVNVRELRPNDRGAAPRYSALAAALLVVLCTLFGAGSALAAGSGAPVNETTPTLAASARDGVRLKTVKGVWGGQAPLGYSYAWRRCDASGSGCEAIAGASKASYKATHQDVGHTLRVVVSATNEIGSASATSGPSALVAAAAPAKKDAPKIAGVGQ